MTQTRLPGQLIRSGSIPATALGGGVISASAQLATSLPVGTVSSSGQVDITATTGYSTFSSSLATVDATQQVSLTALNTATSSYAINSTIQGQLAGVVSSSTQVAPFLPVGTVSSSGQFPGWITASSQIDYNTITNKLSDVVSSSAQFNALTGTSASFALTASYVASAGGAAAGTISSSTQFNSLTDPFTGSFTGSFVGTGVITNAELLFYGNL